MAEISRTIGMDGLASGSDVSGSQCIVPTASGLLDDGGASS